MMEASFRDRLQAGERLAERLEPYRHEKPVVVALPRGGLPVAHPVARALGAPLDVLVVRKIGAPGRPELGVGAVGEEGARVVDAGMVEALGIGEDLLRTRIEEAMAEVERRVRRYRGTRSLVSLAGRTVLIVDDGIATGGTVRAAIQIARRRGASKVVVAVPVAGPDAVSKVAAEADDVVCVEISPLIWAVGLAYERFDQVPDEVVRAYLDEAVSEGAEEPAATAGFRGEVREIRISADGDVLDGDLGTPPRPRGLVLFAHGSGSGRKSRRNRRVAEALRRAGLATLLFDLLTRDEANRDALTAEHRFDVDLLARRMVGAVDFASRDPFLGPLPRACFGSSTGAAAALAAAAERPKQVAAVVSRGGRPDLALRWLPRVRAPCLFLVGQHDRSVLALHAEVIGRIPGDVRVSVVPAAGHLFEEPGALEEVAARTAHFLQAHLRPPAEARP